MKIKIISQTIKYGNQHWRLNADNSWAVLGFGVTPYNLTPHYLWIPVTKEKVPKVIKNLVKDD